MGVLDDQGDMSTSSCDDNSPLPFHGRSVARKVKFSKNAVVNFRGVVINYYGVVNLKPLTIILKATRSLCIFNTSSSERIMDRCSHHDELSDAHHPPAVNYLPRFEKADFP